ncbi:MAG: hypothetical protein HC875_01410 [Anaerolineales bacterium]|nr:hypothetical protein [Anaerolineales bacterium]
MNIKAMNEQGQAVPLAVWRRVKLNSDETVTDILCTKNNEFDFRVDEPMAYPLWVGNPNGEKVSLIFTASSIGVGNLQPSPEEALAELDLPPANPADIPADNPAAGLPLLDDAIGLTVEDEGYFYYTGANAEAVAEFYSQILAEQGWQIDQDLTQISETYIFLNFNQTQGEATVSGSKEEFTNTFLVNIRISR